MAYDLAAIARFGSHRRLDRPCRRYVGASEPVGIDAKGDCRGTVAEASTDRNDVNTSRDQC
jgi:hypothetical protein